MIFLGLSLGPIYMGWAIINTSWLQKEKPWVYVSLLLVCFASMLIGIVYSFTELIQPFSEWTWYQGSEPKINTLNQVFGGMIVSIFIPFAITLLVMIWSAITKMSSLEASYIVKASNAIKAFNYSYANGFAISLTVLSFILFFILTLVLPHTWAITAGNLIAANTYFVFDSPYSLVQGVLWYQGPVQHYVDANLDNATMGISTLGNSTFGNNTFGNITVLGNGTSENITWAPTPAPTICPGNETSCPDPDWLQPMVYLKLYPDVVVYYSMLFFIMAVGVFSTYHSIGRRIMHKRIDVNSIIPKVISLWPLGMCVGEMLLVGAVLALHAYWFWYWGGWGWDYRFDTIYWIGDDQLQKYSRLFGEMTVLTMSFLTIPITHNNIWESVFGVPFDRAVRYHRVLGAVTWLFVTLHMWLWQVIWIRNGTLANNSWLSTTNLIIIGRADDPDAEIHDNNFTIPIMEALWLLGSLSLTAAALRKFIPYEVFQYTHVFMIMFFLMSFIHSFQSWYFTGGGLLLYLYDKCLRLIQSSQYIEAESLTYKRSTHTTRIVVSKSQFGRPYQAGQYCWVNVPAISHFEWHPFTISSAPNMDQIEFTISSMGSNTWTGKLGAFALDNSEPTQIQIDGPFGRAATYHDHEVLILVAGGIGVTPMISMLNQVAHNMTTNVQESKIAQVHFVWVFRKFDLLHEFIHMLEPIISQGLLNDKVILHLYCTASSKSHSLDLFNSKSEFNSRSDLLDEENTSRSKSLHSVPSNDNLDAKSLIHGSNPSFNISVSRQLEKMTHQERPEIDQVFANINDSILQSRADVNSKMPSVACFVCGPVRLTESVSANCYKNNFSFQSEEFNI